MDLMLKDVRLSFPELFEAKGFQGDDKNKAYSATFLVEKGSDQEKAITKAIQDKIKEHFGDDTKKYPKKSKLCIVDGDEEEYEGYEGCIAVRSRNKMRPLLLDRRRNKLDEDDGLLYSGCYVNAKINLWIQDNNWGRRVNCGLKGVQFVRDGEPFTGGGVAKEDDFDVLDEKDAADDWD